jgi:hypothetical protein
MGLKTCLAPKRDLDFRTRDVVDRRHPPTYNSGRLILRSGEASSYPAVAILDLNAGPTGPASRIGGTEVPSDWNRIQRRRTSYATDSVLRQTQ